MPKTKQWLRRVDGIKQRYVFGSSILRDEKPSGNNFMTMENFGSDVFSATIPSEERQVLNFMGNQPKEYGGAFDIDQGTIDFFTTKKGDGTGVDVPHNLPVSWHTHPLKSSKGALQVEPSQADITNFVEGKNHAGLIVAGKKTLIMKKTPTFNKLSKQKGLSVLVKEIKAKDRENDKLFEKDRNERKAFVRTKKLLNEYGIQVRIDENPKKALKI